MLSLFKIASAIILAISFISDVFIPRVVVAAVPILTPEVTNGLWGSFGTVFLFAVMPTLSNKLATSFPVLLIC